VPGGGEDRGVVVDQLEALVLFADRVEAGRLLVVLARHEALSDTCFLRMVASPTPPSS
jgi:hypothetical protein